MELVGLQLDLARQKENVEYIKSYIQFAQQNGYNRKRRESPFGEKFSYRRSK